jgi:hypothetical protein
MIYQICEEEIMKKISYILCAIFIVSLQLGHAATYDFLNIGISARSNAMGGSFCAISHDINTIKWNPAGLNGIQKGMFSSSILLYTKAGVKFGEVQYGFGKGRNTFGFGLNYVNYGSIERRGENNEDLGVFTPMDISFQSGFSRSLSEDLTAGIGVKLVYERIDSFVSYGAGGDIGLQYLMRERNVTIGLSLRNMGKEFKAHDEEKGTLPLSITGGFSFHPIQQVRVNFDYTKHLVDSWSTFKLGAELLPIEMFAFRIGYNSIGTDLRTDYGSDILAGFSSGFGVSWKNNYLDYAFLPMADLGFSHSLTFSHVLQ